MHNFVGIWKLVEARAFDDAGHEVPSPLGPKPMGGLFVEAERIMVIVGDGRVTLPRDAPSLRLSRIAALTRSTGLGMCATQTARRVQSCWPTRFAPLVLKAQRAWWFTRCAGYWTEVRALSLCSNGSARPVAATTHVMERMQRQETACKILLARDRRPARR